MQQGSSSASAAAVDAEHAAAAPAATPAEEFAADLLANDVDHHAWEFIVVAALQQVRPARGCPAAAELL